MRRRTFSNVIIGSLATIGVLGGSIGIVATGEADDGLAGLSFVVDVKMVAGGTSPFFDPPMPPGPNCYTFVDDDAQTWIDPLFLDPAPPLLFPGTWVITEDGAITRYTAEATSPALPELGLPPLRLVQEGMITPALRLTAFSSLYIDGTDILLAKFVSTGDAGFDETLCLAEVEDSI